MKPWSRVVLALLSFIFAAAPQSWAAPPAWAERPVRLIVPSAAGGSGDTLARPLAEALGSEIGQTVVVENKKEESAACWAPAWWPTPAPTTINCSLVPCTT